MKKFNILLAAFVFCAFAEETIINGSFENELDDWYYYKGASIDENGFRNSKSLRIVTDTNEWVGVYQDVLIPENASVVEVEGRMKTKDVVRGKESWEKAQINIDFLDGAGNHIDPYVDNVVSKDGTNEWETYRKRYGIRQGDNPVKLRVECALGNAKGEAWFDNISVVFKDKDYQPLPVKVATGPSDFGEWYPLNVKNVNLTSTYIDWSNLLDKPSGNHGFLKIKGDKFIFEDGTPAKFYGGVIVADAAFASREKADLLTDKFAKLGANLLRLHLIDADWAEENIFDRESGTTKISEKSIEKIDYLISKCKEKGIYVFMDFCANRQFSEKDGVAEIPGEAGAKQVGLLNRKLIDLQKQFIAQFMTHKNPHTGLVYKDDPTIALAEFINETCSYTQFGKNHFVGVYGEDLQKRWEKAGFSGEVPLFTLDYDNAPKGKLVLENKTDASFEQALKFYQKIEDDYFIEMRKFTDSLGLKLPITGSNMPQPILSLVQSTKVHPYAANDAYFDHPKTWEIAEKTGGDPWERRYEAGVDNFSQIKSPQYGTVVNLSYFVNKNQPFMAWGDQSFPNEYRLEGQAVITLYSLLHGWSGLLHHEIDHSILGNEKFDLFMWNRLPEAVAMWAVMSPVFHKNLIKEAASACVEEINDEKTVSNASYSEFLRDNWQIPFITKTSKDFVGNKDANPYPEIPFLKFIDNGDKKITSETGELILNYGGGFLEIRAPSVEGAIGNLSKDTVLLKNIKITTKNPWTAVIAFTADGKELSAAKKFYLAVITPSKMTGQEYSRYRNKLAAVGDLPILSQVFEGAVVFIGKTKKTTATEILPSGDRGKIFGAKNILDLSQGRTYIYEIERK